MSLTFIEETHTYIGSSGREIPSVTRAMDHSGLVNFAFVREEILMRRSELGREAHRAVRYYNEAALDMDSVDPQVMPYLQSWMKVVEHTKFVPLLSEFQCEAQLDRMYYGMTLDTSGIFGGDDSILDFKIGKPHWAHGVQLAGYVIGLPHPTLYTPMAKFSTRKRYGVYLKESGEMAKVIPYKDTRDFQTFWACLELTTRKMQQGQKIRKIEETDDGRNDDDAAAGNNLF